MDNQNLWFALAVVGLVLGAIEVVRSRAMSLVAWAVVAVALALCLAWLPN
jgi:hypothetical protein